MLIFQGDRQIQGYIDRQIDSRPVARNFEVGGGEQSLESAFVAEGWCTKYEYFLDLKTSENVKMSKLKI